MFKHLYQRERKSKVPTLIVTQENIKKRVSELARQINKECGKKGIEELFVICVMKGAIMFTCDLIKNITVPLTLYFLNKGEKFPDVSGKNVLVIEDILDSGKTISFLKKELEIFLPNSLTFVVLLDKEKKVKFRPKLIGFKVGLRQFYWGYGLDKEEKYRNLPYIISE